MGLVTTAPDALEANTTGRRTIFLAGGITGCPDWQAEAIEIIGSHYSAVDLYNPRRPDFDISCQAMSVEQIRWEHAALRKADVILFWFPCETDCPITLLELGMWLTQEKPLSIGCHPNYSRRFDVLMQTGLVQPNLVVSSDLAETTEVATTAALRLNNTKQQSSEAY